MLQGILPQLAGGGFHLAPEPVPEERRKWFGLSDSRAEWASFLPVPNPIQTMKTLLVCGTSLGLLGLSALGIPQTFQGPNTFVARTSLTFEQFATDPTAWGETSALKGDWKPQGDTLTLNYSADVFGIPADQVTARQQDGHVLSFQVVFRPKRTGGASGDLLSRVTANVRAFTGESGVKASGAMVFKYKGVTITLRSGSGHEVVAEFTRA
jgi:hypothetical protein